MGARGGLVRHVHQMVGSDARCRRPGGTHDQKRNENLCETRACRPPPAMSQSRHVPAPAQLCMAPTGAQMLYNRQPPISSDTAQSTATYLAQHNMRTHPSPIMHDRRRTNFASNSHA